jgi:hypothetical protein
MAMELGRIRGVVKFYAASSTSGHRPAGAAALNILARGPLIGGRGWASTS